MFGRKQRTIEEQQKKLDQYAELVKKFIQIPVEDQSYPFGIYEGTMGPFSNIREVGRGYFAWKQVLGQAAATAKLAAEVALLGAKKKK